MERVVRTLFRRSAVKKAPKADELLNLCTETIQRASAQYSIWSAEDDRTKDYLMNRHQCQFLVGRLADTRGSLIQQIQRSPLLDEKTIPVLEELHQVLLDVETVINSSRITSSQWPRAAIEQSDMKETFARLLYGIQWHVSVLQSILVDNSRESSMITFEPTMCEGQLSVGDELSLLTAMKEDEESLKDRLRFVELDDPTEKRLASEFLKLKMRSEEEDHLNTSSVVNDSTGFNSSPDLLFLNPEELDLKGTLLGRGGFAKVKQMKLMGGKYAIKISKMDDTKAFDQEVSALQRLGRHPHIVRLLGYSKDDTKYNPKGFLIMEEMNKSLETIFKEYRDSKKSTCTRPFSDVQAVSLILQIGEGVKYIHSKGMAHRDLKPGNVLVNLDSSSRISSVKIADFGLAKTNNATQTYSDQTLNRGTTKWMAPEVIRGDDPEDKSKFNPRKADVYSFAIVCWEILTGEDPYHGLNFSRNQIKGQVKAGTLRPDLPEDCPPKLAALIERCWHPISQERPLFPEICRELRYIKGLLLRGDHGEMSKVQDDHPLRSLKMAQLQGPWGGAGGVKFRDVGTSINRMKLTYRSRGILCSMEVDYNLAGSTLVRRYCKDYNGNRYKEIVFEAFEFITHISGYTSEKELQVSGINKMVGCVASLTIHTNIKSYGPYGNEEGEPFTSEKGRVVGFHGGCGILLDRLGVVIILGDTS